MSEQLPLTHIDAGHALLEAANRTLTQLISMMLDIQKPRSNLDATDIMNMLIEHIAKLLSYVEPLQLRNQILAEIRHNLPSIVNRHYEERMTTPGGIRLPDAGGRPN